MDLLLERAGFLFYYNNEIKQKYLVVAQLLFTIYVKRYNAIAKTKAAHRITVSRFFLPGRHLNRNELIIN